MENKPYTQEDLRKDVKEMVWENRLQTLAIFLVFFWGVSTLHDLSKKIKN